MGNVLFSFEHNLYESTEYLNHCTIPNHDSDRYRHHPFWSHSNSSYGKEDYDANFNNELFRSFKKRKLIVIEKNGDKVSLKYFFSWVEKKVGNKWFKQSKNVHYISVNTKTGDVYQGFINDYQKKYKCVKQVCRNFFQNDMFSHIISAFHELRVEEGSSITVYSEVKRIFFDTIFQSIEETKLNYQNLSLSAEYLLFKFYLIKKEYKFPNNFYLYKPFFFEKEFKIILKKKNKRVIDSVMSFLNLSGKKIVKVLNTCTYVNYDNYKNFCSVFGEDIVKQDEDLIFKLFDNPYPLPNVKSVVRYMTTNEKRKLFQILYKKLFDCKIDNSDFIILNDHVNYYAQLKRFGYTETTWLSDGTNENEFMEEHSDWANKVHIHRNGICTRIYPTYFDVIETPIKEYYPVILRTTEDYVNESAVQSHCVKNYITYTSSIIVSVRKGNRESDERGTIEYRIRKENNKIKTEVVQVRGKHNLKLDDTWNEVLFNLHELVLSLHNNRKFEHFKITKENARGEKKEYQSFFEDDSLIWIDDEKNKVNLW